MCLSGNLESQRHEQVNAWICALLTIDRDLASVVPDKKRKSETTLMLIELISTVINFPVPGWYCATNALDPER